jgi:hypothetical protein
MSSLYDTDFYTWTRQQAAALRKAAAERVNMSAPLDWENLAEEIESMGRSQAQELFSRYYRLLAHLLKWEFQADQRSRSWRGTIVEQRTQLAMLLEENPGLKPRRRVAFVKAYAAARKLAAAETGLSLDTFPPTSPYEPEQAADEDFWPGKPDIG